MDEANLRLPCHSSHGDTEKTRDSDDADDTDVIGSVHHRNSILLGNQTSVVCNWTDFAVQFHDSGPCKNVHLTYTHEVCDGLSKADGVHGHGHCISERKDEAD